MSTIFSSPKSFRGNIGIIQRNAIQSWLHLRPKCEIILFGDDDGTAEAAAEFKVLHMPHVARNEYGTPLVNALFSEAEKVATYPILCYVNADVILMNDFLSAVEKIGSRIPRCLIVGRRWDVDIHKPLDFSENWESQIRSLIVERGKLHALTGIDFFVFPKGLWGKIPPFAIGRTTWDNWFILNARMRGIPVIDITKVVTVVHQNHDYSHHPDKEKGAWKGKEAIYNFSFLGNHIYAFTTKDASHRLTQKGLKRNISSYFYLYLAKLYSHVPIIEPFVKVVKWFRDNF